MQCSFRKPDRTRCRAKCITDSDFCFFHDPASREEHHEATVRGGASRNRPSTALPPDTPDAPLATGHDVRAFIADALNQVRTGRLGVAVGNCLFVGAQSLLRAIESSELERRLEALEARHQPGATRRNI